MRLLFIIGFLNCYYDELSLRIAVFKELLLAIRLFKQIVYKIGLVRLKKWIYNLSLIF